MVHPVVAPGDSSGFHLLRVLLAGLSPLKREEVHCSTCIHDHQAAYQEALGLVTSAPDSRGVVIEAHN